MLLEDADPNIFGLFATWLYNQKILVDYRRLDACGLLIDLWLFCDRVIAPKLQNQTLRMLDEARESRGALPTTHLRRIYENTTADSALRQYIQLVWDGSVICSEDVEEMFPYQLLLELVASEDLRRRNPDFWRDKLPEEKLSKFFVDEYFGPVRSGDKRKRSHEPEPLKVERPAVAEGRRSPTSPLQLRVPISSWGQ